MAARGYTVLHMVAHWGMKQPGVCYSETSLQVKQDSQISRRKETQEDPSEADLEFISRRV